MVILKGASFFLLIFIYLALGLLLHASLIFIQPGQRYRLVSNCTKILSICIRKILGIKLTVEGRVLYLKERGNFIISNHQSYLDGIILGSLFPIVFVSKLQVKSWPIFGWMSQVGGTIFIDRERKLKSADSIEEITNMLKRKINILLFPEGTSTDGSKILPFQSVFFQAPLNSGSSIIPITIQYIKIDSEKLSLFNRDRVCWYGQIKFIEHVLLVLGLRSIEVKVIIHPKIKVNSFISGQLDFRKQLSELLRQVILNDFSFIK